MKNIYKFFGTISLLLSVIASCEVVDFGDENLNPNQPSQASTQALLTNALRSIPSRVSEVDGNLMVQYISEVTYTEDSRYGTIQFSYDGWYSGPLKDLQEIIDLNTANPENYTGSGTTANQIAVAKILKAYYFQHITDTWGMIPLSEALQGVDNITPKFDSQEEVYDACFAMIDEALASMSMSGTLQGDILFGGNMAHWSKFANTLKLVMALRIADVSPAKAEAKFKEAMPGAISSVAENMHYPYLTEDNNDSPWQDRFQTRSDYAVSDVFIDFLNEHNDPRISSFAELPTSGGTEYIGMPYGVSEPSILQANVSFISSDVIYDGTAAGGMIYSYAQVAFSMAEAAHRGWIQGDVEEWYLKGIDASMAQWNVSSSDAELYKAQSGVAYESSKAMEQIATQKWVSLYLQGAEAWAEWRRLDYPQLSPAIDALNGTGIPVRLGYSANVAALNPDNYQAAVTAQGPDNLDTKLWWDTK